MKKITFLVFLLVSALGFSQELVTNGDFQTGTDGAPFYSGGENNPIEVVDIGGGNLAFRANVAVANAPEPWRVNLSQIVALEDNTAYELTFDAFTDSSTGSRDILVSLGQAGGPFNGTTPVAASLTDTSQTFNFTITTNFDTANTMPTSGAAGSRVIFDMANTTGFVWIDNVSLQEVDGSLSDITLSDLQIDGATISDFNPSTTTYNVSVANAMPVPQITTVTTTNPNATVGTINDATSVPGTATFDVTSENGSVMQTYTVNYLLQGAEVDLVDNGGFEAGDYSGWQQFESTPGNQTITMTNPSSGTFAASINNTTLSSNSLIKSANKGVGIVEPNTDITVKFDMRGSTGNGGVVFVELFSELSGGGVSNAEILGGGPIALNADPNVWTSYEFMTTLGSDVSGGVTLQIGAVNGGATGSFADIVVDNAEMLYTPTLSNESFNTTEFKVFPNPTLTDWNITANTSINSISVFNILGRQVMTLSPNSNTAKIDTQDLNSGVYFARIEGVAGTKTVKLIKQ